ncbi:MAG: hypothetical protein RL112_2935 [Planctomycetota bacterium]
MDPRSAATSRAAGRRASSAFALAATWATALSSCGRWDSPAGEPPAALDLVECAAERGIDYVNRSGAPEKAFILEANGAGAALLDLGSDGDLDLVLAQGLASLEALRAGPGADLEVWENDGGGRFARRAGPGLSGWWTGLVSGDFDNDGDDDLAVGGFGDLAILLHGADGALERLADAGVEPPAERRASPGAPRPADAPAPRWTTSLATLDADGDGVLDLYAANYLDLDPARPPRGSLGKPPLDVPCAWKGVEVYCGPLGLVPQADCLYLGLGDGRFRDESGRLEGLRPSHGLGVHAFDADGDRDDDLCVANDSQPNMLWLNDGQGRFVDGALALGVAYGAEGRAQAGMGVASGDVDRDGRMDFVVTNFSDEPTELHLGAPQGFARATHKLGLLRETRQLLSWGVHLVDFDGDGWLELASANGHVYPQADLPDTGTRYSQQTTRWSLHPEGRARALPPLGPNSLFSPAHGGGRGSAVGDLDGDGRPDLVVVRIDAPLALGLNRLEPGNARLALRLRGAPPDAASLAGATRRTPRDGSGASAVVVWREGGAEQAAIASVRRASGYQSSSTPWLHYGLGKARSYERIVVLWPSGAVETLPGGPADRSLVVVEGRGVASSSEFRR